MKSGFVSGVILAGCWILLGESLIGQDTNSPAITSPISFDTPTADKIVAGLQIFPADNPWNADVSAWKVHPRSQQIIATIGSDKPLRCNADMAYILVPPNQPKIEVKLVAYPDESDPGPYPLPENVPIEGWPSNYRDTAERKKLTLADIQWDKLHEDGDRHAIVVDPTAGKLFEFYQLKRTATGWQAACAAIFDLKSNKLRPDGWTSTDAAGLSIFPAIIRYDEVEAGMVNHAMRFTVKRSRRAYVSPATHFASKLTDVDLPRMGERFRLRANFDVRSFSPHIQAILKGLKKHGMLLADNGLDWAMSSAPDPRIASLHEELRKIKGSDFEVVLTPHPP